MEGDFICVIPYFYLGNFYPRPHMEGDLDVFTLPQSAGISTHALTWRATAHIILIGPIDVISTHALTWRATRAALVEKDKILISTHALTWRATSAPNSNKLPNKFLPTPSHGGRQLVQNGGGET